MARVVRAARDLDRSQHHAGDQRDDQPMPGCCRSGVTQNEPGRQEGERRGYMARRKASTRSAVRDMGDPVGHVLHDDAAELGQRPRATGSAELLE